MSDRKPNVILILTDEQKARTLSAYGNPVCETPTLDALAGRGVLFRNAYTTSPICTPARSAIMTGRYPHTTGQRHNGVAFPDSEIPMPEILRAAGYSTALIGKDHVFGEKAPRFFDHIIPAGHMGSPIPEAKAFTEWCKSQGGLLSGSWKSSLNPLEPEQCLNHILIDQTIQHVEQCRADDPGKPFFAWLSIPDPHTPFQAPEPYYSMYPPETVDLPPSFGMELSTKPPRIALAKKMFGGDFVTEDIARRVIATYYGMVRFIDDELARLFAFFDGAGLTEDTIIAFTSDHGDYAGEFGIVRKSNAFYDCLTRVPLIWSWPGGIAQGHVSEDMCSAVDILPTVLDLCGIEAPHGIQGQSVRAHLESAKAPCRETVFMECGIEGDPVEEHEVTDVPQSAVDESARVWGARQECWRGRGKAIRYREWKFIYYLNGDRKLYNLEHDPWEMENLYGRLEYHALCDEMEDRLLRWTIETEDTRPAL